MDAEYGIHYCYLSDIFASREYSSWMSFSVRLSVSISKREYMIAEFCFEDCLVECISSLRSLSVIHPLPYFLNASFWDMSSLWSPVIASIADAYGYALSAIFKPLYRKRLTLFKQKHRGKAEGILKIYKVDKNTLCIRCECRCSLYFANYTMGTVACWAPLCVIFCLFALLFYTMGTVARYSALCVRNNSPKENVHSALTFVPTLHIHKN